MMTIVLIL